MRELLTARWELVLSAQSFRWVRRSLWGRWPAQCVQEQWVDPALGEAERWVALAHFLEDAPVRYQPVRVSVDASWVYEATVQPLAQAQSWQDVQAYSAMRMQEIFELSQPLVVVCELPKDGPCWVSVMPESTMADLKRLLSAQRLALVSCVPQWTLVWNHVPVAAQVDALLMLQEESSHLVLARAGRVVGVKHWTFAVNRLSEPELRSALAQEVKRLSLPMPARWGVVGRSRLPQVEDWVFERLGDCADVLSVWGVKP